jgi:transposase-like protein
MMTREEIAAIDRECEEQHVSQQEYLEKHGIAKHQYYRWKRRYREEDEQSLVPAGFVPMMPGPAPTVPAQKSKGNLSFASFCTNKS